MSLFSNPHISVATHREAKRKFANGAAYQLGERVPPGRRIHSLPTGPRVFGREDWRPIPKTAKEVGSTTAHRIFGGPLIPHSDTFQFRLAPPVPRVYADSCRSPFFCSTLGGRGVLLEGKIFTLRYIGPKGLRRNYLCESAAGRVLAVFV